MDVRTDGRTFLPGLLGHLRGDELKTVKRLGGEMLTSVPRRSSWRAKGKMPSMMSTPLLSTKMKAVL